MQIVQAQCHCGQKLRLKITKEMLGKTRTIRCPVCKKEKEVDIPEVIHDGTPPQKKEDRYDYDPFAEKGSYYDFISMFGGGDYPFSRKK